MHFYVHCQENWIALFTNILYECTLTWYTALFWINFIFLHGNSIVYYQVISSLYSTGFEPAAISWSSDSCNVDRDVLVNRIPKAVIFVHNKQNFSINWYCGYKKMWNASRFCVSSLRRGHANLLCIVPILVYAHPKVDKEAVSNQGSHIWDTLTPSKD